MAMNGIKTPPWRPRIKALHEIKQQLYGRAGTIQLQNHHEVASRQEQS